MENSESNTAVLEGPEQQSSPEFNEELLNELKMFVANKMFNTVSFQQVLATIDLQCRQQADHRVSNASDEDLQALYNDMQAELAQQFAQQEAQQQIAQQNQQEVEEAQASQKKSCDDPECDEDPETCDKPDCDPK